MIVSYPTVQDNNFTGIIAVFMVGLSTDTKPTTVPDGSLFIETDTGHVFSSLANAWVLKTTGSELSLSDVTDNNASPSLHGFCPKLSGVATEFLNGTGVFSVPAGGGGGGNFGTATVNFGAFPGATDASIAVTGQTSIIAGSVVQVHKRLIATADHSADEHWVEEMDVEAGNISAGTGFTIYAKTRNKRLYGQWNLGWSWG